MPARTARERARAELTREIKDEARRQLALTGADGLSLRAVARELGMVSSALYRYFPSRDELLTALILDAYSALADAAEAADDPAAPPRARMRAVCAAIRGWARAHQHEYALLYGSPVPGYQAPRDTVAPAIRVPLVLLAVVRAAWTDGAAPEPPRADAISPQLADQLQAVAEQYAPGLPEPVLARALLAWAQVFGLVSFELFGQFAGSVEPADGFMAFAVEQVCDLVGLPPGPEG
jgi:AcrR family transcriptional regulator